MVQAAGAGMGLQRQESMVQAAGAGIGLQRQESMAQERDCNGKNQLYMQRKQEWDCKGWKGDRRIFVFFWKNNNVPLFILQPKQQYTPNLILSFLFLILHVEFETQILHYNS
jgi:hypothetical protein